MSTDLFDQEANVNALQTVEHRDSSPIAIIDALMARGASVDELAKLFELQKDHEKWEASKVFASAMVACQKEMPIVDRNRDNTQTHSKYADLAAVHSAIKPVYMRHGFTCSHDCESSPLPNHYRWVVYVRHECGHQERFALDLPTDDEGIKGGKCKTAVQGVASTASYAQRYLECRAFNVTIAGMDKDGNKPLDNTRLSDEQVLTIEAFMTDHNLPPQPFLKFMEVERVGDIYARDFDECLTRLRNKAKERGNANR